MKKISSVIKERGLRGTFKRAQEVLRARSLKMYRSLFQNENFVFKYDPCFTHEKNLYRIEIISFKNLDEISDEWLTRLSILEGVPIEDNWKKLFADQAILWLGIIDDELVARQWTRFGKHYQQWFIKLEEEDMVFFAGTTYPEWRGKRINSLFKENIIKAMGIDSRSYYLDVPEWNEASLKNVARAGFTKCVKKAKYSSENW